MSSSTWSKYQAFCEPDDFEDEDEEDDAIEEADLRIEEDDDYLASYTAENFQNPEVCVTNVMGDEIKLNFNYEQQQQLQRRFLAQQQAAAAAAKHLQLMPTITATAMTATVTTSASSGVQPMDETS